MSIRNTFLIDVHLDFRVHHLFDWNMWRFPTFVLDPRNFRILKFARTTFMSVQKIMSKHSTYRRIHFINIHPAWRSVWCAVIYVATTAQNKNSFVRWPLNWICLSVVYSICLFTSLEEIHRNWLLFMTTAFDCRALWAETQTDI